MTGPRPNRPRNDRPLRGHSGHYRSPQESTEVDRRIRELDSQRDPLSLAEEIASEALKNGRETVDRRSGPNVVDTNIAEMQALSLPDLQLLAAKENLGSVEGLDRQQIIFRC